MLEQLLVVNIFSFFLVFARVGAAITVMPGIGESYVSPLLRLAFAVAFSLVIAPIVAPTLPPVPGSPLGLAALMLGETIIGVFFGMISRIIVSTMHMAGMIIAFQSGLSTASMFDFNQASQGSAIGNLMTISVVLLIFALDLHHLMLRGILDSYSLFTPGVMPPVEDTANLVTRLFSDSFAVAIKISAAHMVVGLIIYLAAGVLSRLMPTMQIFFLIMSPQILISFFLLAAIFSSIMQWYMVFFEESLQKFMSP